MTITVIVYFPDPQIVYVRQNNFEKPHFKSKEVIIYLFIDKSMRLIHVNYIKSNLSNSVKSNVFLSKIKRIYFNTK